MKRILALTLSAALALFLLCACSSTNSKETVTPSEPAEVTESVLPAPTPSPEPTQEPSAEPSAEPSEEPSTEPSAEPVMAPSEAPSAAPAPTPAPTPKPTPTPAPTPEPTPEPADRADLTAFYENVTSQYTFGFLGLASDDLLDGFYPGLTGIDTEQCLVYICQMSMNNGEFGLVQVKNSEDVAVVKAIFQARIDYMVGDGNGPGGAWYPGPTEMWDNNSRVVSNGNYVMMVIHENCDEIVAQFNALF
ncbi:MAG: DUF4358 domain-containing protein [Clostridiales bacterium]|nr:DUF4358 domain-containing protein [Clostridiales bacterium]